MMNRILLTLSFCLALSATAVAQPQVTAQPARGIGQPAPGFTLKDLNAGERSLGDYRGQIAVIVFLSTECPFSNAYIDRLKAVARDYSKKGVVLLGINSNPAESRDRISEHARENGLDFTILKDEGSRVADLYGATRTPEVFVVDAHGALHYRGRIDNSKDVARVKRGDLREALDELLAGKPVSVAETKSFGCPIKMARKPAAAGGTGQSSWIRESSDGSQAAPRFASSFVQQKKAAPKRAAAKKPNNFKPNISLLKPADFNKFKDSVKGKVLVINFWATWCGPCVVEFPEFVALDAKYRDKGVKIVGITADEPYDLNTKVVAFLKEQKAPFQNFLQDTDEPQEMIDIVYKDWQGTLPATFVYDKEGNLVYKRFGIIDREELVAEIEKALK
jgi:peroxiredoxin